MHETLGTSDTAFYQLKARPAARSHAAVRPSRLRAPQAAAIRFPPGPEGRRQRGERGSHRPARPPPATPSGLSRGWSAAAAAARRPQTRCQKGKERSSPARPTPVTARRAPGAATHLPPRKERPRRRLQPLLPPPRRYWPAHLQEQPIASGWRDRAPASPICHWWPLCLAPMGWRGAAWPEAVACCRLIGPGRRPSQASASSGCSAGKEPISP